MKFNGMALHKKLEENSGLLIFGILFVSSIGGLVQVLPSLFQESLQTPTENTRVYTPLELLGRDIYIREACSVCHTQHIRPLFAEVQRYGPYSRAGEFVYDRPFLWGTKRTGPDLHRIGGKYSDDWHRIHFINPRDLIPNSIMSAYPWLVETPANASNDIESRLNVLQKLGHPYSEDAINDAAEQVKDKSELDALIAYMQILGTAYNYEDKP
ncbi:MAG: cytochrome-c oxidase, cbb3-type subunit II [Gammaproteobacteria bacterium]